MNECHCCLDQEISVDVNFPSTQQSNGFVTGFVKAADGAFLILTSGEWKISFESNEDSKLLLVRVFVTF